MKKVLTEGDLSPVGERVYGTIIQFYEADPSASRCDHDSLQSKLRSSAGSPKQAEAFSEFVKRIPEVSGSNLLGDLTEFKRLRLGDKIALEIANRGNVQTITELMRDYQNFTIEDIDGTSESEIYKGVPLSDLIRKSFSAEQLVRLWPKELNDRIDGGARPGHHILIFARPEIGKTLFTINLTAGFLAQNRPVLYVGNEDPASDILLRLVGRLAKWTKHQILENPDEAEAIARSRGYENLTIASLAPGTFSEVRKLVEEFSPKVVILDQLRNMDVESESRVQALEKAATEARLLAKRAGVIVVSVTQAGESAERKAVLERDDVDFSKTGIPAQADLMIGIGATSEMERNGLRTISLPKNKLSGDHSYFTCVFNPQTGVIE